MLDTENSTVEDHWDEEDEDTLQNRYLVFSLESRNFALEIRNITEIIGMQNITQVPEMPSYIVGVINLRGKIIPIIDARCRFKIDKTSYNDKTCIIIISLETTLFGLIVDMVKEVITILPDQIEPPPQINENSKKNYIKSLANLNGNVIILVDVLVLLSNEDIEKMEPNL